MYCIIKHINVDVNDASLLLSLTHEALRENPNMIVGIDHVLMLIPMAPSIDESHKRGWHSMLFQCSSAKLLHQVIRKSYESLVGSQVLALFMHPHMSLCGFIYIWSQERMELQVKPLKTKYAEKVWYLLAKGPKRSWLIIYGKQLNDDE